MVPLDSEQEVTAVELAAVASAEEADSAEVWVPG